METASIIPELLLFLGEGPGFAAVLALHGTVPVSQKRWTTQPSMILLGRIGTQRATCSEAVRTGPNVVATHPRGPPVAGLGGHRQHFLDLCLPEQFGARRAFHQPIIQDSMNSSQSSWTARVNVPRARRHPSGRIDPQKRAGGRGVRPRDTRTSVPNLNRRFTNVCSQHDHQCCVLQVRDHEKHLISPASPIFLS